MARLSLIIDPSGARAGLEDVRRSAQSTTGALEGVARSVDGLDREFDEAGRSARRAGENVDVARGSFSRLQGSLGAIGGAFSRLQGQVFSLQGALAGLGLGLGVREVLREFADFESGLVQVQKTANLTNSEVQALGARVQDIGQRVPLATDNLLELAGAAGQLGVSGVDDLSRFTETLAKLNVATDVSGAEGAAAIARVLNVLEGGVENVDRFGSALTNLGNNLAATEGEILNAARSVASRTSGFGLATEEVLGLSGALVALGSRAEVAGGALNVTFTQMQKAISDGGEDLETFARIVAADAGVAEVMGLVDDDDVVLPPDVIDLFRDVPLAEQVGVVEDLETFARIAGQSAEDFASTFRGNATDALLEFIEGFSQLGSEDRVRVLADLGLAAQETSGALGQLSSNVELVRRAIELANEGYSQNEALNIEAAKAAETFSAQMTFLGNAINEAAVEIGRELAPVILDVTRDIRDFVLEASRTGQLEDIFSDVADAAQALADNMDLLVIAGGALVGLQLGAAVGPIGAAIGLAAGAAGGAAIAFGGLDDVSRGLIETLDDEIDASKRLREELDRGQIESRDSAEAKFREAQARAANAEQIRDEIRAQIEALQSTLRINTSVTDADLPGPAGQEGQISGDVSALQNELALVNIQSERAQENLNRLAQTMVLLDEAVGGSSGSGGSGGSGGGAAGAARRLNDQLEQFGPATSDVIRQFEAYQRSADDAQSEQERFREEVERFKAQPFINALEDVQRTLTDVFEDALRGNLDSLSDFADSFLDIVARLGANLLSQRLVIPITTAVGGALGLSAGDLGIPEGPGGQIPVGVTDLAGLGSALINGLGPSTIGSSLFGGVGANGPVQGVFGGLGLGSAPGEFFNGAFSGGAALGGIGGNLLANLVFGGNRGIGATIGGGIGGAGGAGLASLIGGAAGGPVGLALGGLLGAFGGNALGGLFGPNLPSNATGFRVNPQTGQIIGQNDPDGEFSEEALAEARAIAEEAADTVQALQQATGELFRFASAAGDASDRRNPDIVRFTGPGDGSGDRADFVLGEGGEGAAAASLQVFLETAEGLKPEFQRVLSDLLVPSDEVAARARNGVEALATPDVDEAALRRVLEGVNASREVTQALAALDEEGLSPLAQTLQAALDPLRERRDLIEREGLATDEANTLIDRTRDSIETGFIDALERANREANDLGFIDAINDGLQQFTTQFESSTALSEGGDRAATLISDTLRASLDERLSDLSLSDLEQLEAFLSEASDGSRAYTVALEQVDAAQAAAQGAAEGLAGQVGDTAGAIEDAVQRLSSAGQAGLRSAFEDIFGPTSIFRETLAAGLQGTALGGALASLPDGLRAGSDAAEAFGEEILRLAETPEDAEAALRILSDVIADNERAATAAAEAERALADARQSFSDAVAQRLLDTEQQALRALEQGGVQGFGGAVDALAGAESLEALNAALRNLDNAVQSANDLTAEQVRTIQSALLPVFDEQRQALEQQATVADDATVATDGASRSLQSLGDDAEALARAIDAALGGLDLAVTQRLEGRTAAEELQLVQAGLSGLVDELRAINRADTVGAAEQALRRFAEAARGLDDPDAIRAATGVGVGAFDAVLRGLQEQAARDEELSRLQQEAADAQRDAARAQEQAAINARNAFELDARQQLQADASRIVSDFLGQSGQGIQGALAGAFGVTEIGNSISDAVARILPAQAGAVLPGVSSVAGFDPVTLFANLAQTGTGAGDLGAAFRSEDFETLGRLFGQEFLNTIQAEGTAASIGGGIDSSLQPALEQILGPIREAVQGQGLALNTRNALERIAPGDVDSFNEFVDFLAPRLEQFADAGVNVNAVLAIAADRLNDVGEAAQGLTDLDAEALRGQFASIFGEQALGDQLRVAGLGDAVSDLFADAFGGLGQGVSLEAGSDAARALGESILALGLPADRSAEALSILQSRLVQTQQTVEDAAEVLATALTVAEDASLRLRNSDLLGDVSFTDRLLATGTTQFSDVLIPLAEEIQDGALALADAEQAARDILASAESDGRITQEEATAAQAAFELLRGALERVSDEAGEAEEAIRRISDLSEGERLNLTGAFEGIFGSQSFAEQLRAAGIEEAFGSVFAGIDGDLIAGSDAVRDLGEAILSVNAPVGDAEAALSILSRALVQAQEDIAETAAELNRLAIRGRFEDVFGAQSVADAAAAAGLSDALTALLTGVTQDILPQTQAAFALGEQIEALTEDEQSRTSALSILSRVLAENAEAARGAEEAGRDLIDANDALEASIRDQIGALEDQRRAVDETARTFARFADDLAETRRALSLDEQNLSPEERFVRLQAEFQETSAAARLGDRDALAELPALAREFDDARRDFLGNAGAEAQQVFANILEQLSLAEDTAGRQRDIAEEQLNALNEQIAIQEQQLEALRAGPGNFTGAPDVAVITSPQSDGASAAPAVNVDGILDALASTNQKLDAVINVLVASGELSEEQRGELIAETREVRTEIRRLAS